MTRLLESPWPWVILWALCAAAVPAQAQGWQAEIDKQIDGAVPQSLAAQICQRMSTDAPLCANLDALENSLKSQPGPAADAIRQTLERQRAELAKSTHWMQKAREVLARKLGQGFTPTYCRDVAQTVALQDGRPIKNPLPPSHIENSTPADLLQGACSLTRMLAVGRMSVTELGRNLPPQADVKLQLLRTREEMVQQNTGYEAGIEQRQALFARAMGYPMNLNGCDGRKPEARTNLLAADEFKKGCMHYMCFSEPWPCHYFIGTIIEGQDGTFQYSAIGACIHDNCPDEVAFVRKAHNENTLARAMHAAEFKPKAMCTAEMGRFALAVEAAQIAADDEDNPKRQVQQAVGALATPFTCGLSKPCRQAALRAWDAAAKVINKP